MTFKILISAYSSNPNPALTTDQNDPFKSISYLLPKLGISWPKVLISDFQSQFSMLKIIRIFLKKISLKNIILGAHFLLSTFKKNPFKALYLLKLGPFLVSWFPSFVKNYGNDLRVCFLSVAKLVHRIGYGSWYSNQKASSNYAKLKISWQVCLAYMLE
jgi:hypothetical protein